MTRRIELDEDFLACTLDDIKDSIEQAAKYRGKKAKEWDTQIWSPFGRITVLVRREAADASR